MIGLPEDHPAAVELRRREAARAAWAGVGAQYYANDACHPGAAPYRVPHDQQVFYFENPHGERRAGVGWWGWYNPSGSPGFGIGTWYPEDPPDTGYGGPGDFDPEPAGYADPEGEFFAYGMRDPVGEIRDVLVKMGAYDPSVPFEESVAQLQSRLQVPVTGAVDEATMVALDQWGSSFTVQLVRALDQLGTRASQVGFVPALAALQARFGLEQSGAVDRETARILRKQVYQPSNDELARWLNLALPPSRRDFYADLQRGAAADVAEAAGEAAKQAGGYAARKGVNLAADVLEGIGTNPATYLGAAGSVAARWFLPALGWVTALPLAAGVFYAATTAAAAHAKRLTGAGA